MRRALLLTALLFAPLTAIAGDRADIIAEVRSEIAAMDSLIDDANSMAVRRELHRKAEHIDKLLMQLQSGHPAPVRAATQSGPETVAVGMNMPGANIGMQAGPNGVSITMNGVASAMGVEPAGPVDMGPQPVDSGRFSSILSSVQNEAFSSSKLEILGSAARDNWFTCAQSKQLMAAFDFGKDQVEAGVILYPRVVDQQNWYEVYSVFSFDSDAKKLKSRTGH